MTKFQHIFSVTLATLALSAAAISANAQTVRIRVGDLSSPAAARAFDQRLFAAAERICASRYRLNDLGGIAACETAVREEGLAQLSPQQQAYLQSLRPAYKWMMAGR
jgi:UrcA family protein